MPSKKQKERPEAQSAKFRAEVDRMIASGEPNPTQAEKSMDDFVVRKVNRVA